MRLSGYRYFLFLFVSAFSCTVVSAQDYADGEPFDNISFQESSVGLMTDETLFFTPIDRTSDMFARRAVFDYSAVRYLRRGYDRQYDRTALNGIELSDPLAGSPAYHLMISLGGIHRNESCGRRLSVGYDTDTDVRPSRLPQGNSVSVSFMNRSYRYGARAYTAGSSRDGKWSYALSASGKWGRNGQIDGMFTDGETVGVGVERKLGGRCALSLFGMFAPMSQGLRSAAVKEAFELTGDNLYNPSWGYYDGKLRSAKLRKTVQPFGMLTFDAVAGRNTELTVSVAYTGGRSVYGALSWDDGMNPYPDYYRYLPSFPAPGDQQRLVEKYWRARRPDVVQIDWNSICERNTVASDGWGYIMEEDVEAISGLQALLSGKTVVGSRCAVGYGVSMRFDDNRYYSRVGDALGGSADGWTPYDYRMRYRELAAFASVNYSRGRVRLDARAEVASAYMVRIDSDGGSGVVVKFNPYDIGVSVGYSFSPRQNTSFRAVVMARPQAYTDLFLDPEVSGMLAVSANPVSIASVELTHNITLDRLQLSVTGYYTSMRGKSSIRRYYDDLASEMCYMAMSGSDSRYRGIELAAVVKLTDRLDLNLLGALTDASYSSDPGVDIVAETGDRELSVGERARISGFKIGSTPQTVATVELSWGGRHGWRVNAGANYMADSYVSINPLRRTPRYYTNVGSQERFALMTAQERLPSAFTVDVSVMKSFYFGGSRLFVVLSADNLLGRRDIVYDAYEQMRIRRPVGDAAGDWTVFPTKYRFGYGRSYFCSLRYTF